MDFFGVLDQIVHLLRCRGRVSSHALKRQFDLDDAVLEDVKVELITSQGLAVEEEGNVLVWVGDDMGASTHPSAASPAPVPIPLVYIPQHLAQKILTSRRLLEGERKQVTVLFADMKGSTELIQDLDPEAAQQLLDPAIHAMMDAVHRYEGTVNQVLGDGIMALFGAPIAHEDHALRACHAALAMQAAIRTYAAEVRHRHGMKIQIRVGLNSGEVVVRAIGNDLHMDYSAVGQTTHLAGRMEQLAPPGGILLTADTLQLVEGLVQVRGLGPLPVKGLSQAIEVFELTGVTVFGRRLQAAAVRGLTRFVGRQRERATLYRAMRRAREGHGQVVAVVGEGGVGKSRLVYECIHSSQTQGWCVLESTAVSYGAATPYLPVIDLLKQYFHLEEYDDPPTIRSALTAQLVTLDPMLPETLPALMWLLGALPDSHPFLRREPPQRHRRTLEALTRLLICISCVQPLLLVVEDLHWIDADTQALLTALMKRVPLASVLLLVTYRPEYHHDWAERASYTQIELDPLPPASATVFLQTLLGRDPGLASLQERLIRRTGGNPLFLEESVRTLVETGILQGTPGAYRLVRDLTAIPVPPTVQAVLAARIDRLASDDKRLLQTAAVIGMEAPLSLLRAIAAIPDDALLRSLDHLQAAAFLDETGSFAERVYRFKHVLTHEVAYGSLLQERRRVLHARIVEALEQFDPERSSAQVERLAEHAWRGEVWPKAFTYAHQAGRKAAAHWAYREAVAYFEQALRTLPHVPQSPELHEEITDLYCDLRPVLAPLGALEQISEYLQKAETLASTLGDPYRQGRVALLMATHFFLMGSYEQALASGQRALTLAIAGEDVGLRLQATIYLGLAYHAQGDYRRAIEVLRHIVTALPGEGQRESVDLVFHPTVMIRAILAWCLAETGAFAEGWSYGEEGLRIAESIDHPPSWVAASLGTGMVGLSQGACTRVIPLLERALRLCQEVDLPLYIPTIVAVLGTAYTLIGQAAEALPLLEQAVQQSTAMGRSGRLAFVLIQLSNAYLHTQRWQEAHDLAGRALELSYKHQERGHQAHALRLLGEIAIWRDPPDMEQAEAHYRQSLAYAEELGMRPLQAHCHCGLGTLYRQIGQSQQALVELSTAMAMYREMEMTFWLP